MPSVQGFVRFYCLVCALSNMVETRAGTERAPKFHLRKMFSAESWVVALELNDILRTYKSHLFRACCQAIAVK